ncbi:MAG: hypothetical protein AAGE65_09580 [Planctomycetota bacterium]
MADPRALRKLPRQIGLHRWTDLCRVVSVLDHTDHSVPPTVSWETYRFVIERLNRYGNYG